MDASESATDIATWLRSLGLGQYEDVFRDNGVDSDVLADLTDSDLEKLGVLLGHRKRVLKAIAILGAVQTAVTSPISAPAPPPPKDVAERRQLTVMFCDLVGSTAMSARLDPEDMREVIRAYQDACSGAVARYDGFVAKFMGDGILAYFGFPRAHEDDAERAARAGLDIVAVVAKLETAVKDRLRVRIGIATGIVVVGDVVGQGTAQEQAVVGETPNLAARLQALAEPGDIVIAESTRRLLGGAYELKPLGPQVLKGFDAPVPAWVVLRETENVSRFEASRSEAMTPFVGREQEVALLVERWRDAAAGEGQVVLLSGEAGIGKSRIMATLRERIGEERHIATRYQCSPYHANDAFHPIVGQLWHAAGLVGGEPAAARLDKLEAMIARSGAEPKEIAPLLASLLSVPVEGRYPALEMSPAEIKERTIAALIALFERLTRDAPVLALLEDAHWIDPSSLDVFGRLVERLQGLRSLLVVTFRPEFAAPWLGRAHVTAVSLNRFGRRQAVAMIDRVAGGKALPAEVLEEIVAKTDGVPLFVEELTKNVLESGLLREERGAYVLDRALTPLAIPSTLQDSLMARLDRLALVKDIAQIGAAIGREFSYRLLEAASPLAGPALREALGKLTASDLVYGRGAPPEAIYTFKHALVQDTAYSSLLRGRRQRIHADIAKALLDHFADQIEAAPAIIARHYTEAGLFEPAARYWLKAAELSLSRSANAEADRSAENGLALVPHLTEGPDQKALELALHLARTQTLVQLKGYTAPETVVAFAAAKRLVDSGIGTELQRFSLLHVLWGVNSGAARLESASVLARQMVEMADRQADLIYRLIGGRLLGVTQWQMGWPRKALESLQYAEQFRDPIRDKLLAYRFGLDPGLSVVTYKIWTLTILGSVGQGASLSEGLLTDLASHGHAQTVAVCRCLAVVMREFLLGDFEACERDAADLVAYCAEKKVEQWRLLSGAIHALSRAKLDPTEDNVLAIRTAIDASHRAGGRIGDSVAMCNLAESLLMTGHHSRAEATLRETFAFVEQSGERFWLPDLHRLDGQIALNRPEPDRARAEACFLQAIEVARAQESRMLELRAATDLARLWRDTGSPNDPHALLTPILAVIEGGETLRDVRAARALLAEPV